MVNAGPRINPRIKDTRKLIAKEIELGFLRVPVKLKRYFPKTISKITFVIDGRNKKLSYNPKYGRIFGLVRFFRGKSATPNDMVEVEIRDDGKIELNLKKLNEKEKSLAEIGTEEASEIIDISDLSAPAKGNIVEQRIAELILLYGQGLLNVYKPIIDIEGIDLIVIKKDSFKPIFIQVKSRYNLTQNRNLQLRIRGKNFKIHHSYFIVGAYFNPQKIDLDDLLLFISSEDYKNKASVVRRGQDNEFYAVSIPLSDNYQGIFSKYIIKKENLVNKILEKFEEIEKYIK